MNANSEAEERALSPCQRFAVAAGGWDVLREGNGNDVLLGCRCALLC